MLSYPLFSDQHFKVHIGRILINLHVSPLSIFQTCGVMHLKILSVYIIKSLFTKFLKRFDIREQLIENSIDNAIFCDDCHTLLTLLSTIPSVTGASFNGVIIYVRAQCKRCNKKNVMH